MKTSHKLAIGGAALGALVGGYFLVDWYTGKVRGDKVKTLLGNIDSTNRKVWLEQHRPLVTLEWMKPYPSFFATTGNVRICTQTKKDGVFRQKKCGPTTDLDHLSASRTEQSSVITSAYHGSVSKVGV